MIFVIGILSLFIIIICVVFFLALAESQNTKMRIIRQKYEEIQVLDEEIVQLRKKIYELELKLFRAGVHKSPGGND